MLTPLSSIIPVEHFIADSAGAIYLGVLIVSNGAIIFYAIVFLGFFIVWALEANAVFGQDVSGATGVRDTLNVVRRVSVKWAKLTRTV